MSRWFSLLLVLAALIPPSSAAAYTYGDTLTVIWRPLPNLPAFARPGDSFTVWANAPSTSSGWGASLRLGSLSYPLTLASGSWQSSLARWVLSFQLPGTLPEELYDLSLSCDVCAGGDVARHAVKVIPAYRSDYYFAQISDTHLPEHTFSSGGSIDTADTTGMADFDAVIEDLNILHPEFIIHTGDLVNEGELEEYLGMYEMGRAQQMITRLRDPMFLSSGNHDIGGWTPTAPPPGTSRKDWWRYFGWPFLANPPAGDPYHSQDYSFDYDLLHCIGMEAYQNNGQYDGYMTSIYGAQSMTEEQMNWLAVDVSTVPSGHTKLAFFHYDFGGTLANGAAAPNFSQFSNLSALGLDGAIWGHNHGVPEGNLTARPFNLGLQSVIDGRRTFRIFRVRGGVITPGPMHHSGGSTSAPTDSLTVAWSGPNDGTQPGLTGTVTNRFGETWDHARLVFALADHDSVYGAVGGTVAQVIRQGGIASIYVDCVLPASSVTTVEVNPTGPAAVGNSGLASFSLDRPTPNPYDPRRGALSLRFSLPSLGAARVALYDLSGRRVATLYDGVSAAGPHPLSWNGRTALGDDVGAGLYFLRLRTSAGMRQQKITLVR